MVYAVLVSSKQTTKATYSNFLHFTTQTVTGKCTDPNGGPRYWTSWTVHVLRKPYLGHNIFLNTSWSKTHHLRIPTAYHEQTTWLGKLNLLTPWCRVLLEKLTGLQLVKKFPVFLWNPKVHHRTHKRPPPVPVLGQPNPLHIPTSHILEIHPNIIHPSTPRSPQWSLSLRFPHQDPKIKLTFSNLES